MLCASGYFARSRSAGNNFDANGVMDVANLASYTLGGRSPETTMRILPQERPIASFTSADDAVYSTGEDLAEMPLKLLSKRQVDLPLVD